MCLFLYFQLFTTQVIDEINRNLNDESFGGNHTKPSCHGLVLAMHLKKQMMSRERLVRILQDDDSTLVKNIAAAKLMQPLIEVSRNNYLFVFIRYAGIHTEGKPLNFPHTHPQNSLCNY